jgi:hypothetical protein
MSRTHHHGSDCILIFEGASERIAVSEEGGYVVCRFGDGFGAFWTDGSEAVLISGADPKPTVEAALEPLIRSLDRNAKRRAEDERRDDERALAALTPPQPEDKVFWNADRQGVSVPVEVMLRLLNALPPDAPVREEALKALVEFKDFYKGGNGAILHGIVRAPSGELVLDVQRYSVALYRRKQARGAKELMEQLAKVAEEIRSVTSHLDDESTAESVPGIAVSGEPLIEMLKRPVDAFEAVNQVLRPALTDASAVHSRITKNE